ncbi:hypothetical protein R6Q57_000736, partial [Mikania cordata]
MKSTVSSGVVATSVVWGKKLMQSTARVSMRWRRVAFSKHLFSFLLLHILCRDLVSFYKSIQESFKWQKVIHAVVLVSMWSLWHARNNKLFNNNPISIARIKEEIKSLGFVLDRELLSSLEMIGILLIFIAWGFN